MTINFIHAYKWNLASSWFAANGFCRQHQHLGLFSALPGSPFGSHIGSLTFRKCMLFLYRPFQTQFGIVREFVDLVQQKVQSTADFSSSQFESQPLNLMVSHEVTKVPVPARNAAATIERLGCPEIDTFEEFVFSSRLQTKSRKQTRHILVLWNEFWTNFWLILVVWNKHVSSFQPFFFGCRSWSNPQPWWKLL